MKKFLWIVFLIGLAARLIPVLFSINLGIGLDDMFQYDMLARSLSSGNGYRWYGQEDLSLLTNYLKGMGIEIHDVPYDPRGFITSFRAPLYPVFLAFIYIFFGLGTRFFFARLAQAFIGALLAPLTFSIALQVFPNKEKIARIAAWIICLYPMLLLYPMALATENLFIALLLVSMLFLLKASKTGKLNFFLFAGIFLGLTALTRSVISLFVGLAALWLFMKDSKKGAVLMSLAALLVIMPWVVRNSLLYKAPSFIENSLGYNLYLGYHPENSGTFNALYSLDLLFIFDDFERDQYAKNLVKQFIKEDPYRVPYLVIRKLGYFFGMERRAIMWFYSNNFFGPIPLPILFFLAAVFWLPFIFISLLAASGSFFISRNHELRLIVILIIGYLIPHLFLLSEDRFHMTLVPFIAILAAYVWDRRTTIMIEAKKPQNRFILIASILMMSLLIFNWGSEFVFDWDRFVQMFSPGGNVARFTY